MSRIDTIDAPSLTGRDRALWISLIQDEALRSPLLHPDFVSLVAKSRRDVRILIAHDNAGRRGFLPVHVRPFGLARPIGATFSDYHALIAQPGFDMALGDILAGAGLRAFRFTSYVEPGAATPQKGLRADLTHGAEAFLASRNDENPKKFKQLRRLERKIESEHGALTLRIGDTTPEALAQLMAWKSAQLLASARHDVLKSDWARCLISAVHTAEDGEVRGLLVSLYAGDTLVAAEFGPRWDGVFHPWLAAYHNDFAKYSPGHLLVLNLIRQMPEAGLDRYDLGLDDGAYKSIFANSSVGVAAGELRATGLGLNALIPHIDHHTPGLVGKIVRRWEQIMLSEVETGARLAGIAQAAGVMLRGSGRAS